MSIVTRTSSIGLMEYGLAGLKKHPLFQYSINPLEKFL